MSTPPNTCRSARQRSDPPLASAHVRWRWRPDPRAPHLTRQTLHPAAPSATPAFACERSLVQVRVATSQELHLPACRQLRRPHGAPRGVFAPGGGGGAAGVGRGSRAKHAAVLDGAGERQGRDRVPNQRLAVRSVRGGGGGESRARGGSPTPAAGRRLAPSVSTRHAPGPPPTNPPIPRSYFFELAKNQGKVCGPPDFLGLQPK